MARSKYLMRSGCPMIIGCSGTPMTRGSRLLATVGVQRIELIDDRAEILLARVAFAEKERDIVDLVAIRNREHLSRLDLKRIGLVVVVPVAAIVHAFFGENVEGVVGLDQTRAEPTARPFPGRSLDGV